MEIRRFTLALASALATFASACGGPDGSSDGLLSGGYGSGSPSPSPTAPKAAPTPAPSSSPVPVPTIAPSTTATATAPTTSPSVTPPPPPPAPPALVAMHMQFAQNGDWLMSRVAGEGAPTYQYNGIAYRVMETPSAAGSSSPFYRCIDAHGTHFQSTKFDCENVGANEGLLGYVFTDQQPNTIPIERCIAQTGRPIVTTIHHADCAVGGFIPQGIFGYAFAP